MRISCSRLGGSMLIMLLALAPMAADARQRVLQYAGVNLAGAEFKASQKPGTLFKDYTYPAEREFDYLAGKGMNVVRLPFLWERLQPQAKGEFDATQLKLLQKTVASASERGITVILDVHNYAEYNGAQIGSPSVPVAAFTDLWTRLAEQPEFAGNRQVIFGLMNEPHDMAAAEWAKAAQAAINAIRATGADNEILVPGTAWSGAHSWGSAGAGRGMSNGDALAGLRDPANRLVFEVHQYLDRDSSGTKPECGDDQDIGVRRLEGFTRWLRDNGKTGFLGEFGASTDPVCLAALDAMLAYMQANGDVWRGWTYWAAGAWWPPSYMFNAQPGKDGSDTAQMTVLSRHARQVTGQSDKSD